MEILPEGPLNLKRNNFLEKNIYNYMIINFTQPIVVLIENPVIEEKHDHHYTSVSYIVSGEEK